MKVWERTFLFVVLAWAMAVTVLRAIRLPNDFAEAHWLIDYRFGFVKRGLVGSITALLAAARILPQTEITIRALSLIAFALFCLAMLLAMWRILHRANWYYAAFLVLGVFATSPFFVMNAHLMGYFDHIFLVGAIISAWLVIRDRIWAAAVISAIAVLIHESFVVVGFPVVLFATYVRLRTTTDRRWYQRLIPILLLPTLAFLSLVGIEVMRPGQTHVALMLMFRLQNAGFIGENRSNFVPEWLTTSFRSYLETQSPLLLERLRSHSTWIVVPTVVALVIFSVWGARKYAVPYARLLIIAIAAVPLVLHVIAWDTGRIATYSIFTAFGCAWVYSETNPALPNRFANDALRYVLLWLMVLPLLLFNVFAHEDLMDLQLERFADTTRLLLYAPLFIGTLIVPVVERMRRTKRPGRSPVSTAY